MAFLDNAGEDWDIACAVVAKAHEINTEQRKSELRAIIDALGKSVGYRVGEVVSRAFR